MHGGRVGIVALVFALSSVSAMACHGGPSTTDGDVSDVANPRPDGALADADAHVSPDATEAGDDAEDATPQDDVVVGDEDAATDVPIPVDVVSDFDTETDQHVRNVVTLGRSRGNRPDVFAKIGDSITESGSFLFDCGYGWITLGAHPEVMPTITYFSAPRFVDRNSFNRASECAVAGWSTDQALENYPAAPLVQELNDSRPLFAIVMYGTNDLERMDVIAYNTNLSRIVDIIEANGTVAVLSTIPPRRDAEPYISRVPLFNTAIRTLAATRHLPLIDYWLALEPLPNQGVSDDGVHPSVYTDPTDPLTDSCDFTLAGLQYGYNVRNLTAIQMLARLAPYGR